MWAPLWDERVLLHTFALITGVASDKPIAWRTHVRLIRITGAHSGLDGLGGDRDTFVVVADEVVITIRGLAISKRVEIDEPQYGIPLIIWVFARAVFIGFNGVLEFMADIAIRIGLSSLIPLLQHNSKKLFIHTARHTHLAAHNALRLWRSCIPFLEIMFSTLPQSGASKIEEHRSNAASIWFLIFAWNLPQENELLRCWIGNSKEHMSAKFDPKVVGSPIIQM